MKRFLTNSAGWLALSIILCSIGFAQITPLQDAYTNSAAPKTNYGAATLLYVNGDTETAYIQFNLASIPSGAIVSQATLKLYVNAVTTAGSFNVDYINGSWSESTITYNLAPALGTTIESSVPITTASTNKYILINITPAVQAWLSGSEPNDGIALVANSTFDASFDSKENTGTSHPAELDIVFEGPITGITTAAGSGLTGGGESGTLNLSLTTACTANQVLEWNGSAWACTNVTSGGGGTITGVTAGSGLTGGGSSGNVTLAVDPTQTPLLAATNTFNGTQTVGSGDVALTSGNLDLPQTSSATTGVITMGGAPFISACCANNTFNTFIGEGAGNFTISASGNTAVGYQALTSMNNLQSTNNTAVGATALTANLAGASNTAVGVSALLENTYGTSNTAVGASALQSNTQGLYNTAVGQGAGSVNTGNSDTFIGQGANPSTGGLSNATAIGANAIVGESNALVLGASGVNVGIGTTAPAYTLDVHGTANFTGLVTFAANQTFPGAPGPAGPQGPTGPTGPPGPAATVQIGTVTTGSPGSQASVTNAGTSSAAVLNFTIPQGISGAGTPPSSVLSAFLPGPMTQAYTAASLVPDSAITVTRISAALKTAPDANCQPSSVRVTNGTTGQDLLITAGQSLQDSGPIEMPTAAGSTLQVNVQNPANCPQANPTDTNVLVQYRGEQSGDTQTCAQSGLVCNGICEETQADPNNCGSCGKACGSLPNVSSPGACTSGACTGYTCSSGYADCANAGTGCNTNTQTNSNNCGSCGNACSLAPNSASVACVSGACAQTCNSGFTNCNNSCTALQTDANNCGTCGSVCSITAGVGTAACSSGSCTRTCAEGPTLVNGKVIVENQTLCGSSCSNLGSDSNNCGSCGNVCPGGGCNNGTCPCAAGQTYCPGPPNYCSNLMTDENNCGSCGYNCDNNNPDPNNLNVIGCSSGVCQYQANSVPTD